MRNFWGDTANKDDEDNISNGDGNVDENNTSNDAIIALALAEEYEQQTAAASSSTMGLARQHHYSQQTDRPKGSRNKYNMRSSSSSSSSGASISKGIARPVVQGTRVSGRPSFTAPQNSNRPSPSSSSERISQQQQKQPSLPSDWMMGQHQQYRRHQPSHMCYIPCLLGGGGQKDSAVCVEMMVDTGADASVISWGLAQQLHLDTQLDRSQRGIAAGVGTAPILGKLHNVVATVGAGHVEFYMDFLVLDVPEANTGKLLILGMDQLRKYQCLLDLQRNVLIFGGGTDGVEVPMLPAEQVPAYDPRGLLNAGEMCTVS